MANMVLKATAVLRASPIASRGATWTTGIAVSQCPFPRDTMLVTG